LSWNEKLTWNDFDLRGSLESIHCLRLELKHWIKRRLKTAQGNFRNLTMQSPTTAQLGAAIVGHQLFGEHINHTAANTVIGWPEAQHYDRHAVNIEARTIEQIDRIQTVGAQLENWRDELPGSAILLWHSLRKPSSPLCCRGRGSPGRIVRG
jgi:hypothetical protein